MGLFGSVKKRFVMQLVSVSLLEHSCKINVKKLKNSNVIHRERKTFDIESKDKLSSEVINYLNTLQSEHEQTYVALFLNTLGQGAISGCSTGAFEKFGVDKKNVKSICIDKEFTIYASFIDIQWVDKIFQKVGLDFIFSPFLILNHFAQKETLDDKVKLYILNTNNGLTIMIKQGKKLLYGSFFNVAKEEDMLYDDFEDEDSDSVDVLDEDLFDEFDLGDDSDVDDMEDFDSGDDFDGGDADSSLSPMDTRLIRYLDASLDEFYRNEIYDSDFITDVKIYDDAGMNIEVIKHIENDLLLDTSAENINILEVISEIAEEEVMTNA